jgi:hypothetical protein
MGRPYKILGVVSQTKYEPAPVTQIRGGGRVLGTQKYWRSKAKEEGLVGFKAKAWRGCMH